VRGKGWVRARQLRPNDELQNFAGNPVPIIWVGEVQLHVPARVYDLRVEPDHTYYVGRSRVLVHNKQ
jgi:hypothetical protein